MPHMMKIIYSPTTKGYLPKYDRDLALFQHFCEGAIEVKNINRYHRVFRAHGWAYVIEFPEEATHV